MTTVRDVFVLPEAGELSRLGFVERITETGAAAARRMVGDYVVTPTVEQALPDILGQLEQCRRRGEDRGWFVHGSFGSGKSFFLAMLGMVLEGREDVWQHPHPVFRTLEAAHRAWLAEQPVLVVRVHMLSERHTGSGLDRAVYSAFNATLLALDRPPCVFSSVDKVLDEARREAERYGDTFWQRLTEARICRGREAFEARAAGSEEQRERLAHAYLKWSGRDPDAAHLHPPFAEGMRRLAAHAKELGYAAVTVLVDELILWLREKKSDEFAREINNLNLFVDYAGERRAAPVWVFVARQRDIAESFPDDASEARLHEHLDWHRERFELTELKDVELRHIVRGRVLKRQPEREPELRGVIEGLQTAHEKALPELLAGRHDADYLKDVYPFHPALIEAMVDISTCQQRERSALRLLYELLVVHYPDLPLGEFLPVGSAFDAIFPESGVEGGRRVDQLRAAHAAYYQRLLPALRRRYGTAETCPRSPVHGCAVCPRNGTQADCFRANQLVKTVLLGELAPRLKGEGLTVERLVRLNSVNVPGAADLARIMKARGELQRLAADVPVLNVQGDGKATVVSVNLGDVPIEEVLRRVRPHVTKAHRHRAFFDRLRRLLGVHRDAPFSEGARAGAVTIPWRGTRRRGYVSLCNVREERYDAFRPPDGCEFHVLVDYPWDEPGFTVDDDRQRAQKVRAKFGNVQAAAWLPSHFTETPNHTLGELAAVVLLRAEPDRFLQGIVDPVRRQAVLDAAGGRQEMLEEDLDRAMAQAYREDGEVVPLLADVDTALRHDGFRENLESLGRAILDRVHPHHPEFPKEVVAAALTRLADWMVEAATRGEGVEYDDALGAVLDAAAAPLELVSKGQSRASLREDTRYVRKVLELSAGEVVDWPVAVADELASQFGFQTLLSDLFLHFVVRARSYRTVHRDTDQPVALPAIGARQRPPLRLRRARVLSPARWTRVKRLAEDLLAERPGPGGLTVAAQDALDASLREEAKARRRALADHHEAVARLLDRLGREAEGDRLAALKAGTKGLAPLDSVLGDSYTRLEAFAEAWPEDGETAAAEEAVTGVVAEAKALGDLDGTALKVLLGVRQKPQAEAVLDDLAEVLGARDGVKPLRQHVPRWNRAAESAVRELIESSPPKPPDKLPPPPPPPAKELALEDDRELDLTDGDALGEYVAGLRGRLAEVGRPEAEVQVRVWVHKAR